MKSGFLEFNKGKIYYEISGSGEPMVLVNGFTLDRRIWEDQINYFENKYKVISFDLRGHGKSSIPITSYSYEDDLEELVNKLELKNIILVGLSLGGEISINYTLRNLQNVKKLILADSSLGGYKSTVDWNTHGKEFGVEVAKKNWLNHDLFRGTSKNKKAFEKVKQIIDDYPGWHFVNDDLWDKVDTKAIDLLNKLIVPTLVVTGENDLSYYHNIADYITIHAPNVLKQTILNSGHMVNMEKPQEFNKLVEDFISM